MIVIGAGAAGSMAAISSPNTLRKIVRSWPLNEQVAFFEGELGLPLEEEEESANLFPSPTARAMCGTDSSRWRRGEARGCS